MTAERKRRKTRKKKGKSLTGGKDLHASAQAQHQVQRRLLGDPVVLQGAPVLQLLAREDQPLLVGRDPVLVLDLALDGVHRVVALGVQGDGLACGSIRPRA